MSLTYQPFAEIPQVEILRTDLRMNVPDSERIFSGILGAGAIAASLPRSGAARWVLLAAGAALIARAWSGRCLCYEAQGVDRRHPARGVAGNTGSNVESSIEIHRAPELLYHFWRDLQNLPRVMRHVASVQTLSNRRSRWKVKGPVGQSFEWDAEIINDQEGRMIAWQSLPDSTVANAGSVWFEPTPSGGTILKVSLQYAPPGGKLGAGLAGLMGCDAQAILEEDLSRFKQFAERELIPFSEARS